MFGITMRYRMKKCVKMLESDEDNMLAGDTLQKLWQKPKYRKAIKALSAKEYVRLINGDNQPSFVILSNAGSLYLLERGEIWLNRIIGFVSGVVVTVAAELIVRLLL